MLGVAVGAFDFDAQEQGVLERFADEANDHLGLLVGAGPSIAAGLPAWGPLVSRLLHLGGVADDVATARELLLSGQDILLATEVALGANPKPTELLYKAIYETDDPAAAVRNFNPSSTHFEIARLALSRSPDGVTLMTLNVDDLIEDAIEDLRNGQKYFSRDTDAPRSPGNAYEIHHLHGIISRDGARVSDRRNLVFTLSDYNRLLRSRTAWQLAQVNECLQRGPLMLVGTSYGDVDIRCWLDELFAGSGHLGNVYPLLCRQSLNLSVGQFQRAKSFIRNKWSGCILLDSYGDVVQALREITHIGQSGYRSPIQRIKGHWTQVTDNFTEWQRADSDQLETDLRDRLSTLLGREANLTLWLVDGDGKLARWASSDRVNRSHGTLRRIDLVPESPWVAAQALSAGSTLVTWEDSIDSSRSATHRWQSAVAQPVFVELPGGPSLGVGVISSASAIKVSGSAVDDLGDTLTDLADTWASRLKERLA